MIYFSSGPTQKMSWQELINWFNSHHDSIKIDCNIDETSVDFLDVTIWFCYQKIAIPGNKMASPPWPDPYVHSGKYWTRAKYSSFCKALQNFCVDNSTMQWYIMSKLLNCMQNDFCHAYQFHFDVNCINIYHSDLSTSGTKFWYRTTSKGVSTVI